MTHPVAAVLAVKRLGEAKSRLAATLPGSASSPGSVTTTHRSLVLAMLLDTIAALGDAGITRIVVVSPDDEVLAAAGSAGFEGLREGTDGASATAAAGLNRAFDEGSRRVRNTWPDTSWLLLIQADLPAATGASLTEVLGTAAALFEHNGTDQVMLADRNGTGTVLLLRRTSRTEPPRFGADSAAAHRGAGAVELDPARLRWADLRTDVDTADDLAAATTLGLGDDTKAVLAAAAGAAGHG